MRAQTGLASGDSTEIKLRTEALGKQYPRGSLLSYPRNKVKGGTKENEGSYYRNWAMRQ